MNEFADAAPTDTEMFPVPGKIYDECLSLDVSDGHKTPKTTIVTLVPVIAHNK